MATIITADGKRTAVRPENGNDFSIPELEGIVGGSPLAISEMVGDMYTISLKSAEEIGAEFNHLAVTLCGVHIAHTVNIANAIFEGKAIENGEPEFYGTVVFCSTKELGGALV